MGMLANRLRKNYRHISRWARRQEIECYRLYHDDIPEYPIVLEMYGDFAVAQVSWRTRDEDRDAYLAEVSAEIQEALDLDERHVVLKDRGRRPGGTPTAPPGPDRWLTVNEHGLRFDVNLTAYHDTGLFLDHRLTRQRVREQSAGRRVLNLFAYTGSFSVYAGAGGAAQVTSVDLSNTYLEWAERNLRLNGLDLRKHALVRHDILTWRTDEKFDLVICDPPTFSNSKAMRGSFDVGRDHPQLLTGCLEVLAPGGVVVFSTNDQKFRLAWEGPVRDITAETTPEDFKGKTPHRCWEIRTKDTRSR